MYYTKTLYWEYAIKNWKYPFNVWGKINSHDSFPWQQLNLTSFPAPGFWLSQWAAVVEQAGCVITWLIPACAAHGEREWHRGSAAAAAAATAAAGAGQQVLSLHDGAHPHHICPLINLINARDSGGENGHSGSQTTNFN